MSSFKSSENIQKKEGGPDRSVSDNQFSSVTLNELAVKARKDTVLSSFSKEVIHLLTLIEMGSKLLKLLRIYGSKHIIFSDFSEYFCWSQRTKSKKIRYEDMNFIFSK